MLTRVVKGRGANLGNFASVTCSAVGTIALNSAGEVYSFGWGQLGGVGHGSTTNALSPMKVCEGCESVSSGFQHSGAVSTTGEVYTFGWGKRGQCGHSMSTVIRLNSPRGGGGGGGGGRGGGGSGGGRRRSSSVMRSTRINFEDVLVPTVVQTLSSLSLHIAQISCGFEMTAVLTDTGHVYVFGQGLDGQLGLGEEITQTIEPLEVSFEEFEEDAMESDGDGGGIRGGGGGGGGGGGNGGEVVSDNERNPNEAIGEFRVEQIQIARLRYID